MHVLELVSSVLCFDIVYNRANPTRERYERATYISYTRANLYASTALPHHEPSRGQERSKLEEIYIDIGDAAPK